MLNNIIKGDNEPHVPPCDEQPRLLEQQGMHHGTNSTHDFELVKPDVSHIKHTTHLDNNRYCTVYSPLRTTSQLNELKLIMAEEHHDKHVFLTLV